MLINSNVATVDLTGSVETVEFSAAYAYYWLSNQSDGVMYASLGDPVPEAEGTYTINPGCDVRIPGGMSYGKINVIGTGKLMVYASNIAECPINSASSGGGSGADEGAVKTVNNISPDDGNVQLTADNIPDGNSRIIPDFKIEYGMVTNSSGVMDTTITFSKEFTSPPIVICTASTYVKGVLTCIHRSSEITKTQAKIRCLENGTATAPTSIYEIYWVAMGV